MRLWWLTNGETYKISVSYSIYSITVSISLCPALAFHKGVVYCDGGYYHLPFSLCLSRLVGSDTCRGLPLFGYIKGNFLQSDHMGDWQAGWHPLPSGSDGIWHSHTLPLLPFLSFSQWRYIPTTWVAERTPFSFCSRMTITYFVSRTLSK